MELEQACARLPPQWRRVDLKRLLGSQKSQAAELIRTWMDAGYVEDVPGLPLTYRFTAAVSGAARNDGTPARAWPDVRALLDWFASLEIGTTIGSRAAGERSSRYDWTLKVLLALVLVVPLLVVATHSLTMPASQAASETATEPGAELRLTQAVVCWYAPGHSGEVFGAISAGTRYRPVARYGEDWLQVEFDEIGLLWVRASDFPAVALASLPDLLPPVVAYSVYTVLPGEDLRMIAARGGSEVELIQRYNHVGDSPPAGRPLIVPQLDGQISHLTPAPVIVKRGSADAARVALTLDVETGGEAEIRPLLDLLRERQTRLTMFVPGTWLQQNPELVRQMVADGHELGSHSLTHADFRTLTEAQIAQELAETERLANELGSTTRPFFRPPYGGYNDQVLLAVIRQGYLPIHWSIDSYDSVGDPKTPELLLEHIIGPRKPEELRGDIILAHCCSPRHSITDALPIILDRLAEMGLEVVTVSEVLGQ